MVLGLRSKNRKGASVQVDYLINVQEIKPWPLSQNLKSAESVSFLWENGEQSSGSFTSVVGDGKIEINESFRLPVTFYKEVSKRGSVRDSFQKNYLEFSLYEPRKDKPMKSQLLGSAVINLADYGIIHGSIIISALINFKKSSKSTVESVLYVNIQQFERHNVSLSKEVSLDRDGSESVSEVTYDGNDDEREIASFTDDDIDDNVSSHSSRTVSSFAMESNRGSPGQDEKILQGSENGGRRRINEEHTEHTLPSGAASSNPAVKSTTGAFKQLNGASSPPPSKSVSSNSRGPVNDNLCKAASSDDCVQVKNSNHVENETYQTNQQTGRKGRKVDVSVSEMTATSNLHVGIMENKLKKEQYDNERDLKFLEEKQHTLEEKEPVVNLPREATGRQGKLRSNTLANNRASNGVQGNTRRDKLKHLQSVQLQFDVDESDEPVSNIQFIKKAKKIDIPEIVRRSVISDRKETANNRPGNKVQLKPEIEIQEEELLMAGDAEETGHVSAIAEPENFKKKVQLIEKTEIINIPENIRKPGLNCPPSEIEQQKNSFSGNNIELESEVEMLKEELIEAAAVEVGLYSVVAEHGSSINKVHAPARRLSRFYLHACKASSRAKKANAARAIVSGLVLVSKACGNDVSRLTFWLSNSIVLRAILCQNVEKMQVPAATSVNKTDNQKGSPKSSSCEDNVTLKVEGCDECEEDKTFIGVLERLEAWIFSRIIESVWWQTLIPHMQSTAVKGSETKKSHARRYGLGDQDQGNFAIDLWKKAFRDACERLCPIRSGGHECGCLPLLARLVMEQLVHRLDVAMFNAILRESAEEMPTDPVSDPISDPKVLPIPAGKSSFGAGAQLKNAVGNWSMWLTDLFGIDDKDELVESSNRPDSETSFKIFHLLNGLSDLMMLPFEMLADRSIRIEVCPIFGAQIVKRVLSNFVPDEFNPDPIPDSVFSSLDSENQPEDGKESITSFPCIATPTIYSPPSTASLINIIGEVGTETLQRSGSSLLKKSYASDDELDELDSPLASIIVDNSRSFPASTPSYRTPKGNGGRNVVRYELLRQIWKDDE
ncbi:uncharacterized protein LOC126657762 [Mercurialis annua]|uniref:uncharacterized protein LOC126657762 n=1 Tax=Mercurialis annua TaxID=3986 RepID=UPI00215EEE25|nr:uncharacterized protein LOC126657762 [Mercurialis annua]XP_050208486.1 uncharacterized protein LOC126657762 [Mercurialis annua]